MKRSQFDTSAITCLLLGLGALTSCRAISSAANEADQQPHLFVIYVDRVVNRGSVEHLYGFIDVSGKIIIEPMFAEAQLFHDGLSLVSIRIGEDYREGYIDRKGKLKLILPDEIMWAGNFLNDRAVVNIGAGLNAQCASHYATSQ